MSKGKVGGLLSQDPALMCRISLQRSVPYWRHRYCFARAAEAGKKYLMHIFTWRHPFLNTARRAQSSWGVTGVKCCKQQNKLETQTAGKRRSGRPQVGACCHSPRCWLLSHHSTRPGCSHTLCQRPKKIHTPVNTRKNEGNWQNPQIIKTARI